MNNTLLRALSFQQIITHLHIFSLLLLIIVTPFQTNGEYGFIVRTAMILAGSFFLIEFVTNKRWKNWQWTANKWLYVMMIAFYLYTFIWHIFSDETNFRFNLVLEQRVSFFIFGIIGLLGWSEKIRLRNIACAFVSGGVFVSLLIILNGSGWSFFTLSFQEQSVAFMLERIRLVTAHTAFNLYLNVCLIFGLYVLLEKNIRPVVRGIILVGMLWIFYILCLTEGRVGLATCFGIVTISICVVFYKYSKKFLIPTLLIFILIAWMVVTPKARLKHDEIRHDPRKEIWGVGWESVKDSPIWGHGVCDGQELLISTVKKDPALYDWWSWKNDLTKRKPIDWYRIQPHNTILEVWNEFGIIGVCTLLFFFVFPLFMSPRKHRLFFGLITMCFGVQWLFDTFILSLLYGLAITCFAEIKTNENDEFHTGTYSHMEK